jgi:hypothetical protein
MSNSIVFDYYKKEYDSKVMFFNSKSFKSLNFRVLSMYKVYRQQDEELKNRLIEVGYNEHTEETLDYFNQRVMSINKFEADHSQFIRLAPTNAIVNKINSDYISNFVGKSQVYKCASRNWKGQKPNDEEVTLKEGIQVMCGMNHYEADSDYRNGTIGVITELHPGWVQIQMQNGKKTNVVRSTVHQYEMSVNSSGDIDYTITGYFDQIDCKPMKACTIHKGQGRQFDSAYVQLNGWITPGLIYVALSRVKSYEGLGLSRKLTLRDIQANDESFQFLEFGFPEEVVEEKPDDGDELI